MFKKVQPKVLTHNAIDMSPPAMPIIFLRKLTSIYRYFKKNMLFQMLNREAKLIQIIYFIHAIFLK